MQTRHRTRVVFFPVKDLNSKLVKIVKAARYHFSRKEHFLIQVADEKAAQYVDDLLWKIPEDGFLPHVQSLELTEEYVVITKTKKNLNNARFVFNLCPSPLHFEESYQIIYELEDLTTPSKQMLSRKRFEAYKQAHYILESR